MNLLIESTQTTQAIVYPVFVSYWLGREQNSHALHYWSMRYNSFKISTDLSSLCRYYKEIYRELFGEEYQSNCEEDDSLSASESSDNDEDTQNDLEKAPWPQELRSASGSLYLDQAFSSALILSLYLCISLSL